MFSTLLLVRHQLMADQQQRITHRQITNVSLW